MVFGILEVLEPFLPVMKELILMSEDGLLSTMMQDLLEFVPIADMRCWLMEWTDTVDLRSGTSIPAASRLFCILSKLERPPTPLVSYLLEAPWSSLLGTTSYFLLD